MTTGTRCSSTPSAESLEHVVVGQREVLAGILDVARRRHVETSEDIEKRRLSAARSAEQRDELAVPELEVDAAQRDDVDLAHAVDLPKVVRGQERSVRHVHVASTERAAQTLHLARRDFRRQRGTVVAACAAWSSRWWVRRAR
jgi:hypothetical protein